MDAGRAVERYERFFREAEPMLRRVAFVYTGNSEQAHDLAQETLIRAWQHWSKVANHPHPDAWWRTVLSNLQRVGSAARGWSGPTRRPGSNDAAGTIAPARNVGSETVAELGYEDGSRETIRRGAVN